eukprot:SAG22_NODE_1401_length_4497_cov_101.460891_7_plen_55_part_00
MQIWVARFFFVIFFYGIVYYNVNSHTHDYSHTDHTNSVPDLLRLQARFSYIWEL